MLKNMIDGLRESIKEIEAYKCPCCDRRFDLEAVLEFTDNGEVPTCLECGERLEPVDGE
jgi:NAD-dependent SIR2 family protein deacetylase